MKHPGASSYSRAQLVAEKPTFPWPSLIGRAWYPCAPGKADFGSTHPKQSGCNGRMSSTAWRPKGKDSIPYSTQRKMISSLSTTWAQKLTDSNQEDQSTPWEACSIFASATIGQ